MLSIGEMTRSQIIIMQTEEERHKQLTMEVQDGEK